MAGMRAEYDQDWPLEHDTDLQHPHQSACDQASSSLKQQPGLWVKKKKTHSFTQPGNISLLHDGGMTKTLHLMKLIIPQLVTECASYRPLRYTEARGSSPPY